MKPPLNLLKALRWASAMLVGCALAGGLGAAAVSAGSSLDEPSITAIRVDGSSIIISAHVPAGLKKVTLQSSRRLGTGAWEPRAIMRLDGQGGEVTFELPKSPELEIVRVRADESEPLPNAFYRGTNQFPGIPVATGGLPGGPVVFDAAGTADGRTSAPTAQRDVVESDIWQIDGDSLYFFNQYRGLQVIDVSNADAPVLRGTLLLPAAGEQMYLLGDNRVILLARDGCNWSADSSSQVMIVNTSGASPTVETALPVSGDIQESRLVGTALYVLTQAYRPVANKEGNWEWGTQIYAFDLSDPTAPVARPESWFAGYGNVLSANDRYLFVAITDNDGNSQVYCVNIANPDGTMAKAGSIRVAGRVADKFKMHMDGDVLTVISEKWGYENTSGGQRWRPVTTLETFSLAEPTPTKLGELRLADGEQLHATRFDEQRVYVVTYFRVDPLWVVDLSDPRHPAIKGELKVPGWSTYIQPLGDRLLTIGIDDTNGWRVAVSLFDVHDPAAPALLSKVPLGENSSWSEANSDEKAFGFVPDAGLILVPYSSYSTNLLQGVQLIDFNRDALTKRGFISHDVEARRSTVHKDRILSVSARELLSVDAADRDHPVVKNELELSWPVNRVFVQGDYLIELETTAGWGNGTAPTVRVVAAAAPDKVLGTLVLGNLPVAGATVRNGRLYLLQGQTSYVMLPVAEGEKDTGAGTNQTKLVCSVLDLTKLPALSILGSAESVSGDTFNGSADPVWPKPELLVWAAQQSNYWGPWLVDIARPGIMPIRGGFWYPYWGGDSKLYAVDVANEAVPAFVSQVSLTTTNGWSSTGKPFVADNSVFFSRQITETTITGTNLIVTTNVEYVVQTNGVGGTGTGPATGADGSVSAPVKVDPIPSATDVKPAPDVVRVPQTVIVTNEQPIYVTRQLYYLHVIDYSAPSAPLQRQPITIPGTLRGLAKEGALLYLVGYNLNTDAAGDGTEWLHACAYDGVSTFLVDSMPLINWPHAVLASEANVFVTRPEVEKSIGRALEAWTVSDAGKFTKLGERKLASNGAVLQAVNDVLVVQEDVGFEVFDLNNPVELPLLGAGGPGGCVYANPELVTGSRQAGLWLPLDIYGLYHLELKP